MRSIEVDFCPRCGEDHRMVAVQKFRGNFISSDGIDFNYWGWCPSHLDPIIFSVDDDEETAEYRTGKEDADTGKDGTLCGCPSECKDPKSCPDEAEQLPTD